MRILLAIFLSLASSFVSAQTVPTTITLSWIAPTTRENGSPLPQEEIARYEISDSCSPSDSIFVDAGILEYSMQVTLPYNCSFAIRTIDSDQIPSEWSDSIAVEFNRANAPVFNKVRIN